MASIAKLVVTLGANTASFETDMQRAAKNQSRRMAQLEQSAKKAAQGLAVAFTAIAGSMTALVVKTANTADATQKMAQRLGTSTEALSELSHVADLSGVKFNQLTVGMQRMERRIAEVAALGKGEAKQALEQLGLSAKELADLPVDKQFEAVAEQLSKVESQSEKVRLAFKLFDSEGVALVQTMGEGAAGIQAMRKEAQQLGKVISTETADAAVAFNDNLTRMAALAEGAGTQFTGGLLPALVDIQDYFLEGAEALDVFQSAGEKLGAFLKQLVGAFIILRHAVEALIRLLIAAADLIFQAFKAIVAPITATTQQLAKAFAQLSEGDVTGALSSLGDIAAETGKKFTGAVGRMENATEEMAAAAGHVKKGFDEAVKVMQGTERQAKKTAPPLEKLGVELGEVSKAGEKAAESVDKLADAERRAFSTISNTQQLWADSEAILDELIAEQQEYEQSLAAILDTLFPVQAAGREFGEQLAIIARHAEEAGWSQEELNSAVQKLTQSFDDQVQSIRNTTEEFDLMKTAIDEGVRILERTFTSLWDSLLTGAGDVFDVIVDGFKAMLANLVHQATTQRIILNIQQGLQGTGTGPGGGINYSQLFGDFAKFAAIIGGTVIGGGGQFAAIGSIIGSAAGQTIGASIFAGLGSVGGPLGMALGAALGGLLGGLFDKKKTPRIGAGGFNIEPGDTRFFGTDLGGVFVGDTKGGMDEYVDEFGQAIAEFDDTIGALLTDTQLETVTAALQRWSVELKGDAISIENLLGSRFRTILSTFGDNIQEFVNRGVGLEKQLDRFQVAAAAQGLLDEVPFLEGRTLDEFLAVVEAFQTGTQSITDAYNEVLVLLNVIGTVYESLQDFAGSDLADDFRELLAGAETSLAEALAGMNAGLMDAIANFDGSPEQLQQIGLMVTTIREGELKLLAQIDDIQKGIQANLAALRAELTGLRDGPRTDEQLFNEAERIINSISSATSAEEIAALEREFSAAIRALSPEAQQSNMTSLLDMVDTFQSVADTTLEGIKQSVLDNAQSMREMVSDFIDRIGDPLDIIASTNEQIRDALNGDDSVIETDQQHESNVEEILENGVNDISDSVANIGPFIANALRNALGGVEIKVAVYTGGGLNNE